ncbi:Uu.00g065920.m01.CDS01 [Anthostomella pinea]|uniref:Uu.00g065920.m01.CDS01 n=1 Tax=Anthostomella pinea TaxID=933095 RepID=A0AAI8YKU3_9PEZI|nr:Uu.00g065920.m01.CDS01 [Anthostomella pinea]
MPPIDNDSQFRFLISCIRHSASGKVDFEEVRKECDIVTRGAAAKRYERLMKAHGIAPSGATGTIKKEGTKEPKETKPRAANKKRKLAAVEDDVGDIDEPVKAEKSKVKGEVKFEDAITVKTERPNDGGMTPTATPGEQQQRLSQSQTATFTSNTSPNDDDDEVFLISATQRQDPGSSDPVFGSGHHHSHSHSHSHPHSPNPIIPGIHTFDYATNMGFPQQLQPPPPRTPSSPTTASVMSNSFPYGFTPTNWMYPHGSHGYL